MISWKWRLSCVINTTRRVFFSCTFSQYCNSSCYNTLMGSGKGQSRRARASATKYAPNSRSGTKIKPAVFYRRKWEEFVADNSLADVLLCDYYLGGRLPAGKRGWASHEKLLSELFKDARSEEHTSELQS